MYTKGLIKAEFGNYLVFRNLKKKERHSLLCFGYLSCIEDAEKCPGGECF